MTIGDIHSEAELLALGETLGAGGLSPAIAAELREAHGRGADPLGDALCALRSPVARRRKGATYTPPAIVESMVAWAKRAGEPTRIVDPGAGSGRFLLAAARAFPRAHLVGVEIDPVAAAVARANLNAAELGDRAEILVADYRAIALSPAAGPTLFLGNPPYVRHHHIDRSWKAWLSERARARGLPVSQLAGLHLHFLLATLERAAEGDFGSLITSSEWLDVNYGALARALLAGPLGLKRLDLIDPRAMPFADAQTTGVIASFRVGARGDARIRRVETARALGELSGGAAISRRRLHEIDRWSTLDRPRPAASGELVELGELCRVHRGQVTGQNRVWIAGEHTPPLPPSVLHPAITRAKELFAAEGALATDAGLRKVIDLPIDLDALDDDERRLASAFLRWAAEQGARDGYIARHRSPWWSVRLREPAPILATYMARRPPAFVRNTAAARHLNIAHGLYPTIPLSSACLDALAAYLARSVQIADGRTYAGGLTKFEPREMQRLRVPRPEVLAQHAAELPTRPPPEKTHA